MRLERFSQCLRDHALPYFVDLTPADFAGEAGTPDRVYDTFVAELAERSVDLSVPASYQSYGSCDQELARDVPDREAQVEDHAACMRDQGVGLWPDPDFDLFPDGGYPVTLGADFDLGSSPIIDAYVACQAQGRGYLPDLSAPAA